MINQYYCAFKDFLLIQNEENGNPLCKADLMTMKMRKLFTIVSGRKERNKKLKYDERFDREIHPYKMIQVISQIEECLWSYKYGRNQSMCASIRDRFQFLMTLSGCLKSESTMKADLSDLCDLVYHQ